MSRIYNDAVVPFSEDSKRLCDLFLEFARPLIIWREDRHEKMPSSVLKDHRAAIDFMLAHPVAPL